MAINIIDMINAKKYLPKKFLKFKLSFFNNALINLTDTYTAKKDKNKYINILTIAIGKTNKMAPKTPFI